MKIEKTEITPRLNSYISIQKREEPFFQSPFHFHPELELVYILESYGKRIVGNSVEDFGAGDMVFLGTNLPHVWLNDEMYYRGINKLKAKAIIIYFNKDVLGNLFYQLKETNKINALFSEAIKGLSITGKTNMVIAEKLKVLLKKKDFDIIVGLFEILSILSNSKDISCINNESYTLMEDNSKTDRLSAVYKYVKEHYSEDITLAAIAQLAHLTPPSFCRLFKQKTKKHFVEYLTEVRISNACKYLMETDTPVSAIAYRCGFKTISNFNKLFKKITGVTPQGYKKSIGG